MLIERDTKNNSEQTVCANEKRSIEDRVRDMADEIFDFQLLGERRAYDDSATGEHLIYKTNRNGYILDGGQLSPEFPGREGYLALVRAYLTVKRAEGFNVLVWRMLPHSNAEEQPAGNNRNIRYNVRFRCAFTTLDKVVHHASTFKQPMGEAA